MCIRNGNTPQNFLCDFETLGEKNQPLRENYFVRWESFCTFVAWDIDQIKKGGNGKQNKLHRDLAI